MDAMDYCQGPPPSMGEMVTKSKSQMHSGNYINVVPIPVGVQYHRRKYSPQISQEYSARVYYSNDFGNRERCREDFFPIVSAPATEIDSLANNSVTSPPSSMMYAVQRVVTTSQIQTATSFPSNSATVATAVRNESDGNGMQNSPGATLSTNYQAHTTSSSDMLQPSSISLNNYMNCGTTSASTTPRPLQNVIPTCVYLMSRIAVHMEIEGTAQCPAQVMLAAALGCEELGIANKLLAQSVFGLWMTSPLLEIQLKPHNRPYAVRSSWTKLLEKHSHGNAIQKKYDEPMIGLKRSVYFSKKDEEKIKDPRILELLYEEARHNVLSGRYIMEPAHSIMLGGIQARIELGPYNVHTHTIGFFRENQLRFLPAHVAKSSSWSWLPVSRKTSAEVRLLEQFKRVPTTATTRKLMRKYLEFCWALPFYGAAFFHGQVEQPVRGLMSLVNHKDSPVIVAINEKGLFVIDHFESTLILGLRYEELSWDYGKPSVSDDPECLSCIFIQFDAVENGIAITKLMQIFSRQAPMMDALLSYFAEQMKRRREGYDGQPPEINGPEGKSVLININIVTKKEIRTLIIRGGLSPYTRHFPLLLNVVKKLPYLDSVIQCHSTKKKNQIRETTQSQKYQNIFEISKRVKISMVRVIKNIQH
ncbi:FERM domain-containing protein 8 [Pseudolycoriella hygida]|uniref:FERM domain-containing protein 8 n=1 Tax=Pseudolycoriella hygida TaxID=35572 RepID=A0A9Q0S097_9DIPT|nr:FERM domain-containing protein 8 [Pseudolycoriella hygida]